MPEIVEIEILRKETQELLKGIEIKGVVINKEAILNMSGREFSRFAVGEKIENARRKGKVLIVDLSNGYSIAIHFLLTGFMKVVDECEKEKVQVGFLLSNGKCLYIGGIMRGGFVKILKSNKVFEDESLKKLGIDAMSPNFTLDTFNKILVRNGKKKIKQILMDQTLIAGIGNAYSDEILFRAGVRPDRKALSLNKEEIKKIFSSIPEVFKESESFGGESELTFVHLNGKKGEFQKHFKVHKRAGKLCPGCEGTVQMIKINGRSSYYCPECQK